MIERGSGVAVWRQIENSLAEEIASGAIRAGEQLATELQLAQRFRVNRHTIRRAVATLVERGLLRVEQGRGTFVQDNAIDYAISKRTRFSQNMASQNLSSDIDVLASDTVPANAELAELLQVAAGEPLLRIKTLSRVELRVVDWATLFFPAARFPGLPEIYRRERSVTRALAHFGVDDYTRRFTRVSARLPDSETVDYLGLPKNRPVLHVKSLNVDAQGRPVQYGITCFNGDLVQLVMEDL
ncbi:phosphonate metabolism transcriptional regulator PhnF [Chromobacterium haemolyticum]|uniref:phosphonate metabolism transcriptional regulator PhnF n=1 Tax=Chromobacterium haemolyticum TaxID=394935 RepID=UPI0009D9F460|nr:phosphonate metabolism transcriptional regulator PhnF [Chromobacterium haemolyticum]MDH0342510.1 phosphonate metabolism transcriptional regulator PhnF [Chromobacterium haemolyticum]OQS35545.1 phosphonate metabolism transcriptional regulator PhnF [Chromobacterium haemolyticum]PTU69426.1 phosphonate metabolism transcriptional regulator PhnF [Chromobacterium haemolyticum]QOD81198.1 phosphonate metabolism transcriptional regulator PhnF [Chromobacterium haemolyticum]BBH13846.1 phosphonate metabo